jgi:alpha-mannosidase
VKGQASIDPWLQEIRRWRYREVIPITTWHLALEGAENTRQTVTLPVRWGGYDQTVWWYQKITIPVTWNQPKIAIRMDIPEGLVFLNQQVYQGIDVHHPEILLPTEMGSELVIAIQAYSGRKQELNECRFSELVWINPEAEQLYTWLEHLVGMRDEYSWAAQSLAEVMEYMNQRELPISECMAHLVHALSRYAAPQTTPTIHLIGHSHMDVVWLWTLQETRRKLARTFGAALNLMQEFPDFCFLQGQAQLYAYVQQDYPEIYQRIKTQVQAGRWQIEGAVWVEPDGNLINGESWVRQLVYGQRFWQQEFQHICHVLWLPDSFGYHGNLPQLLQQVGVQYFFTTKLNWNDTAAFPFDSFWWQGIDGTRVLAHQPPVGLEGLMSIRDLDKSGRQYEQKTVAPVVLQTFGYGDGGGGVTRQHLHIYQLTQPLNLPFPHHISSPRQFFQKLAEYGDNLPIWQGELYLEKHRGTYTTHSQIKQLHRQAERELYLTELLATLAWMQGYDYPQRWLEQTWKLLLLQQFHDILPGTFIKEAYPHILADFTQICADLFAIRQQVWEYLSCYASAPYTWTVVNPIHTQHNVYVVLPIKQAEFEAIGAPMICRMDGQVIPYQVLEPSSPMTSLYPEHSAGYRNILCLIPHLAAHSFAAITLAPIAGTNSHTEQWHHRANQLIVGSLSQEFYELANGHFQLVIDAQGDLVELWDKRLQKNILPPGQKGGELKLFLDRPKQWEAWDIDADYLTHPCPRFVSVSQPVIEQGILRSGLVFSYQVQNDMGLHCHIKKSIYLYHDAPWIEFFVDVDLTNNQYAPWLLKILFPFDLNCPQATFDIPFGMIQRSTCNPAQFEVPALSWADLSTPDWGVSVLSRDKYGFSATPNTLGLTLLRVAHYPDPIEPWHRTDTAITDAGTHQFCCRLYPHVGSILSAQIAHKAQEFLHPPLVFPGTCQHLIRTPILILNAPNLLISSIKKAMDRDGIIIRIYEAYGRAVTAQIQPQLPLREVWECDLLENPLHLISHPASFPLTFTPFMVKTLCLIP